MGSKMGRPIIGERKEHDLKVKLGNTLFEKLVKYCEENGLSKAEVIRKALERFLGT